jgi:hypothetical protein
LYSETQQAGVRSRRRPHPSAKPTSNTVTTSAGPRSAAWRSRRRALDAAVQLERGPGLLEASDNIVKIVLTA